MVCRRPNRYNRDCKSRSCGKRNSVYTTVRGKRVCASRRQIRAWRRRRGLSRSSARSPVRMGKRYRRAGRNAPEPVHLSVLMDRLIARREREEARRDMILMMEDARKREAQRARQKIQLQEIRPLPSRTETLAMRSRQRQSTKRGKSKRIKDKERKRSEIRKKEQSNARAFRALLRAS